MLTSLALIFLVGLSAAALCQKLKLPRLIGMLLCGMLLGPYILDWLAPSILGISAELRKMALVIILIRAGLSLNLRELLRVGRPAVLLAFLPASFEIAACLLFAPRILGITTQEAAILGTVLAAVSPAVVVPRMVQMIDQRYGTRKNIPQMILAGASLDDVVVIVLFTAVLGMVQGEQVGMARLLDIPVAILTGIALGTAAGMGLAWFFACLEARAAALESSVKTLIMICVAFLLLAVELWLEGIVAVSGLLAVMSMALTHAMRSCSRANEQLKAKFGKLWLAAEVLLFALVGAAVDLRYALAAGIEVAAVILLGLVFRSLGVWCCLLGTELTWRERLYCTIAYLPKATVQAAIGSLPLSVGLPCGSLVLSAAVLAILITAPLGAIGLDLSYPKLLEKEEVNL